MAAQGYECTKKPNVRCKLLFAYTNIRVIDHGNDGMRLYKPEVTYWSTLPVLTNERKPSTYIRSSSVK